MAGGRSRERSPPDSASSLLQGQELTIRQISLLGFRDLVLLKVKLGDLLLLLGSSQLPPSIVQMLLILQVRPRCRRHPKAEGRKAGKRLPLWIRGEEPNDQSTVAECSVLQSFMSLSSVSTGWTAPEHL